MTPGDYAAQQFPPPSRHDLARLSQAFANYREYRTIFDKLNAMSDRDLADIGLSRHNVRDVAREAVYGD